MSKRHQRPQRVEHNTRAHEPVDIHLPQILDRRHPLLIQLVYIVLQAPPHVLQHLVDDADGELEMVALQVVHEHREEADAPVLDLPGLREDLVQGAHDGGVGPIELADELEDFVESAFGEDVVDEVSDEELHGRAFFDADGSAFRRVALRPL